jgi:hypothetical protein
MGSTQAAWRALSAAATAPAQAAASSLDGVIDTVSAHHEIAPLFDLLRFDGKLVSDWQLGRAS